MTMGSLCAGIGGFGLGFQRAGFEIAWQVEIDEWCQKVLAKNFPHSKKFRDVREVGRNLEWVDVICAGFPCQPFSTAGKRGGAEDDRYLWPEMLRVVNEVRPSWFIGENVPGILSMEFEPSISEMEAETFEGFQNDTVYESRSRFITHQIIEDLERIGYDVQIFIIPACGVDAWHRRDRVWILAHSEYKGMEIRRRTKNAGEKEPAGKRVSSTDAQCGSIQKDSLAHSESKRRAETWTDSQRSKERTASTGPLANSGFGRCGEQGERKDQQPGRTQAISTSEALSYPDFQGLEVGKCQPGEQASKRTAKRSDSIRKPSKWLPEPPVGRVAPGFPGRVAELTGLGNAVVPQIPEIFARFIMEIEANHKSLKVAA